MRIGIVLWSLVCAWTIVHSIGFYQSGESDYSILFGTAFMIALYLFISYTVKYIKEDYPLQIRVVQKEPEKKEENDTEE